MKKTPLAYSYVRFSTPSQAEGDSLRRQTEAAEAWCKRNQIQIDTSTTLHDLGKSAYTGGHRKNPDRHALAAFLKLVEDGRVPRGSFLVIENLDRLSREHIQPALLLALHLLQAGIRIVQLKPSELVFDDQSDTLPVMMMMMELSRGHGESAIKSERIKAAWEQKRKGARERGSVMTHRLPAWIEERGGQLRLIAKRVEAIRRIFELAANGYGHLAITVKIIKEKVPSFGSSGHWARSYVAKLLNDRRLLGEFQPRFRDGTPEGEALAHYYPEALTEKEYAAARAGAAERRLKRGRIGNHVNVFSGLLYSARDGESYFCTSTIGRSGEAWRIFKNTAAHMGRARTYTFPFIAFESAILKCLREVPQKEILDAPDSPSDVMILAGELTGVETRIAELEAELFRGDVASLARVLRQLETQKKELGIQLLEARQKETSRLAEVWGEAQSLCSILDNSPDPTDTRLRLRSVLRRMIDSIWLLVGNRGLDRLCAAQVWFKGGQKFRNYRIMYRPRRANANSRQAGRLWVESLRYPVTPGVVDLRKREDAEWELEQLLAWNPEGQEEERFGQVGRIE